MGCHRGEAKLVRVRERWSRAVLVVIEGAIRNHAAKAIGPAGHFICSRPRSQPHLEFGGTVRCGTPCGHDGADFVAALSTGEMVP